MVPRFVKVKCLDRKQSRDFFKGLNGFEKTSSMKKFSFGSKQGRSKHLHRERGAATRSLNLAPSMISSPNLLL